MFYPRIIVIFRELTAINTTPAATYTVLDRSHVSASRRRRTRLFYYVLPWNHLAGWWVEELRHFIPRIWQSCGKLYECM